MPKDYEEKRAMISKAIAEGEAVAATELLPSVVFAALKERGKQLDLEARNESILIEEVAQAYHDLIHECYVAGNNFLAAEFEEKAILIFKKNPKALTENEWLKNDFEENACELINFFTLSGNEKKKTELLKFIDEVSPSSVKSINEFGSSHLKQNLFDFSSEYEAIQTEVEDKIFMKIGRQRGMGFCHLYWSTKREILKTDYGVEWDSPAVLNPHILFD